MIPGCMIELIDRWPQRVAPICCINILSKLLFKYKPFVRDGLFGSAPCIILFIWCHALEVVLSES